jgi:flagellar protein FliO/FliZ
MIPPTIVSAAGVLIGIIVLILGAAKLYRFGGWRTQPRSDRTLILRESITLDPRRRVHRSSVASGR